MGRAKDVELVDRGRFRLKGFPERWRLYEVVWQEESPAAGRLSWSGRPSSAGRRSGPSCGAASTRRPAARARWS